MLKRIYIHNYRTFVNFEWEPPPACVLVGANGVGKSALVVHPDEVA
jgi:predicted ATPase